MDLYVYSDESGVFDRHHNDFFVFGGIIFVGKNDRDVASRKYIKAERAVRESEKFSDGQEIKASVIKNASKGKLYRSLNAYQKFGVVVRQKKLMNRIFDSKKDKQRYLDFAYKMGVKTKLQRMIKEGIVIPGDVSSIHFYVDEHTTATNGRYELREGLEQEFKWGTFNYNYQCYFPPIFPNIETVTLDFCNSAAKNLVRAADIVANKIYFHSVTNSLASIQNENNLHIHRLP